MFDVSGIDAPVPGLAIATVGRCDCGDELYGVMHIRSGAGLFFSHSPENFGEKMWDVLGEIDWTRSATEIDGKQALAAACAALKLVPDSFVGEPATDLNDVNTYVADGLVDV